NHNHDLKNIFKGASAVAAVKSGPFQRFYAAQISKGIRPEIARLSLARKIAAIILTVWKKGAPATPLGWLYESETLRRERGDCRALGAIRIQGTTWLGS
ncbi:MAG TPA: hypothetical protein VI386_17445, partial [Candidatus Sulfotelmatobacter sp.]